MHSINILLGYASGRSGEDVKKLILENIVEDISNLLNAKPQGTSFYRNVISILDYGIPDLSHYSPYSIEDQRAVGKLVERCLKAFEPRLSNIVVEPSGQGSKFRLQIKANVAIGQELIALELEAEGKQGEIILRQKIAK